MERILFDEIDAAKYLGEISPRTLQRWRLRGSGPQFLKIGDSVRYDRTDLDAFLSRCRKSSTSASAA